MHVPVAYRGTEDWACTSAMAVNETSAFILIEKKKEGEIKRLVWGIMKMLL